MMNFPRPTIAQASSLAKFLDSDLWYGFTRSPRAMLSATVFAALLLCSVGAPIVAPYDPFTAPDLMNGLMPPAWQATGSWSFPLGTDDQGRDVLSLILYGTRMSLLIGFAAVSLAIVLGVTLGLLAGYLGGALDSLTMRIADVQLSFPAILVALLISGIVSSSFDRQTAQLLALPVLVLSIGMSDWVQYARTARGSTLVEKRREYVQAARIMQVSSTRIVFRHILPNILGPIIVIGTLGLGSAIITEATLSFLGVGLPPTQPSLGTLIRTGNDYLFSGEWWITVFPALSLVLLALSVNVFGDWLREALNPRIAK